MTDSSNLNPPTDIDPISPDPAATGMPPAASAPVPPTTLRPIGPGPAGSAPATPIQQLFQRITGEISKIYVGQDELVLSTMVALFSSGHVLIESVPGLGKTLFVRTLGK